MVDMAVIHGTGMTEENQSGNDFARLIAAGDRHAAREDYAAAIEDYQQAAKLMPDEAEAWVALGYCHQAAMAVDRAAEAFNRAQTLAPERTDIIVALAGALDKVGRGAEAESRLRNFLQNRPDAAMVMQVLADILVRLGRLPDALAMAREATSLHPEDSSFTRRYAGWLAQGGQFLPAIEVLSHASHHDADDAANWLLLGEMWAHVGEPDKASAAWRHYRNLLPDDPAGTQARGEDLHTRRDITQHYIQALFDSYAKRFDGDLEQRLRYQAPKLLHEAYNKHWHGGVPPKLLLDLGCGTGLAGAVFADLGAEMIGIDLSPRMLELARERKIYRELIAGDIVTELAHWQNQADLIIAADVLIYLGDLHPVFVAAQRALRFGGLFAFTVEASDGKDAYTLQDKRRYAYRADYLKKNAAENGLSLMQLEKCTPRYEAGVAVKGLLLVVKK
jgi:predicted TPR repeat methyltransferase